MRLSDFVEEVNERTTVNNEHPVLTSSKSGVYLQSDYFNKRVASDDNTGYKIIRNGEFTYRAMSDTGEFFPNRMECVDVGIVSPAYPVFRITQTNKVDGKWLKHFFKSRRFQALIASFAQGSTRTSVKLNKIITVDIDVPEIELQRKVVDKLEMTAHIIECKRAQLNELDLLIKARFVEMFGDLKTNPHGYDKHELRETCKVITGNTPPRDSKEYYGDYVEWIKTDNIVSGRTYPTEAAEFLSEEGVAVGRTVDEGAILMACIAGSIASIGRVCITNRKVAFNQQINAIVPHDYDIHFLYIMLQIAKNYLVEEINMALKGILSKSKLEDKAFYVPPIGLQKEFSSFVQQVDKSKAVIQKALDETQLLFDSLMQEYFG